VATTVPTNVLPQAEAIQVLKLIIVTRNGIPAGNWKHATRRKPKTQNQMREAEHVEQISRSASRIGTGNLTQSSLPSCG
jgi:hypothetical protein